MKHAYYRKVGINSLAEVTLILPVCIEEGCTALVSHVFVPKKHRKRKIATALMQQVLSDADAEGVNLMLSVDAGPETWTDDALSEGQLVKWYEKLGFECMSEMYGSTTMIRKADRKMYNSARVYLEIAREVRAERNDNH